VCSRRVSESWSWLGNYPKLPLLQTFLTIRSRNRHRFGCYRGNRERIRGTNDRLVAAGGTVVEGNAEAEPGDEGDAKSEQQEQAAPRCPPPPRRRSPHGV